MADELEDPEVQQTLLQIKNLIIEPAGVNVFKRPPPRLLAGQNPEPKDWLLSGDWATVASSNVRSIKYRVKGQVLTVWFLNGSVYEYRGVPPGVAAGLFCAESVGKYLGYRIKGKFPYGKVKG